MKLDKYSDVNPRHSRHSVFWKTMRRHAGFATIIVCYAAMGEILGRIYGVEEKMIIFGYGYSNMYWLVSVWFATFFFVFHALHTMIIVRPESLHRHMVRAVFNKYLTKERLVHALPVFVFLPLFISVFTSFKNIIPTMNSFRWDPFFAHLDSAIHGGVHPWQWLQPILGYPNITTALNFFYHLWLFITIAVLIWQAFSMENQRLRMQFLSSFVLSWILLGTVLAVTFSSVGPCYYERYTNLPDPYHGLMTYLRAANEISPVWALNLQEKLWDVYSRKASSAGSGISAMPSIHVSAAFLYVLLGWATSRAIGAVFSVFAFLILIGSVHFGWHYAIDGYAAILLTWLIWRFTGWLLDRYNYQ